MISKEQIIQSITQRIKDEQRKHEHSIPDWHEIAARKIYATIYDKKYSVDDFLNMIHEFEENELPNRNEPYHYEAEIASGLKYFARFIEGKQPKDNKKK